MGYDLDRGAQDRKAKLVSQAAQKFGAEMRQKLKAMLDNPDNRLIVSQFMEDMGVGKSPFSPNAMTQSHAIGKQEAAQWWIDSIRAACPEKELPMRREYQAAMKSLQDLDGNY